MLGPVLAGIVVAGALVAVLPSGDAPSAPAAEEGVRPSADAAARFTAAFERSRRAELVVESIYTRTFNDGRELSYDRRIVQRPPDDLLVFGAGSASGRLDGRIVRCTVGDDGPSCIQGAAAPDFDDQVADEVDHLAELLDGVYSVADDGAGCWVLTLELTALPDPPYGGAARFCFDDASGALAHLEERHADRVEVTDAHSIRTTVTDADLAIDRLGDTIQTG